MKGQFGRKRIVTYTPATTINIEDTDRTILVDLATSGVTCSKILSASITVGRRLTVLGTGANAMTLTDNTATTTRGQFDLGGSNRSLVADKSFELLQLASGAWRMVPSQT